MRRKIKAALSRLLHIFLVIALLLSFRVHSTPVEIAEAAHGSHTMNLHSADVLVSATTYNTISESAITGTLDTATAAMTLNVEVTLRDAAGISTFVSTPVPAGSTWDISGSWTFNPYIKLSTIDRFWVRARVYRISSSGTATQVLYSQNGTRYESITSYTLISWSGTVPTGTTLQAGERFGVAFFIYTDRSGVPTGYLGFEHSSAPSNVAVRYLEGKVSQAHFRIGQDTSLTSMAWYANTDTTAINIPQNTNFRVRFQAYNTGAGSILWKPRLDWSATQGSGYAAMPTASGAQPFFVTDTTQYTNGAAISTANFGLGTGTGTAQNGVAYDTQNPPTASITLNASSYTEIEFNIKANSNASMGYTYYFRLTNAGNALNSYDVADAIITMQPPGAVRQAHFRIGQDTPLTSMTWYANTDATGTNIPQNTNFRVRFQVYNNGYNTMSWTPRLDWSATQGSGYAAVPTTSGAQPFFVADTTQFTNGAAIATAYFALGTGTGTAQSGIAYDTQNPAGAAITLNVTSYTEIEFNIQANNNASPGSMYYFRLTNNGSALNSYDVSDAIITIQQPGVVRQAHFRIGQDTPLTSMTWYAGTDATATNIPRNTSFRVRFQLYNSGASSISWTPRLDWSATQGSGYAAVPNTSGAQPFFVADTTQYTNGTAISTANFGLGTGTGTAQNGIAYDTQNPASAAITLNVTSYTEIEFNIQANNNATLSATYYFRLTSNGSALNGYDVTDAIITMQGPGSVSQAHYRIGQDTPLTSMTWYANTDTSAASISRNTNLRVRFQLYNNGASTVSWTPRLDWSATQGSGYATVPTTSGAQPFFVADTTQFSNGVAVTTTYFALGAGTGTAQDGIAYDTQNPAGASFTLNSGYYTEIEFNIQANNNASPGSSYYFRLTNNGSPLDGYDISDAIITIAVPVAYIRSAHYRIGQDTGLATMNWYAATDTAATALPMKTNFRVRYQLYNNGDASASWRPQLEWSSTQGSGYAAVPTASSAQPFFISDTPQYTNGAAIATAYFALGTGTGTPQAGVAYDTQNPASVAITLNSFSYTEIEFSAKANDNASEGASYFFRLTDNGTLLTLYEHPVTEVIVQNAPAPPPTPGPPAHNLNLPYSANTAACAGCHRGHTSNAPTAIQASWPEEQTCFTCHDGTGAPNIQAQYNKTYKMPVASTAGIHSLSEWRTMNPSSFSGANRHVECADCHNPHYAATTTHTIGSNYAFGPQQNVWGIKASYTAAWTSPTFATVTRITYQYELCFKCHSSWAFGSSPPTVPSGGFPETDIAKEFNPLNASYMPVMAQGKNPFKFSSGASYASSLIGGFTPTSRMVCSDCHKSETGSEPKGPHGSTNPFILGGAWNRTTGQMPGQKAGGGVDTSSHLCFQCHNVNVYAANGTAGSSSTGFSGGGKNLHTLMVGAANRANNNSAIVCMDCHIAVPHGYYREHLIGYTGDGSPYINRPYSGGLTTINTWRPSGQWTFSDCGTAMNSCK